MPSTPRPCARCGRIIPAERTELLPETRLCVGCSGRGGGEFDLTFTPENVAKAGSMKKNYSSFRVEKRRRPVERD